MFKRVSTVSVFVEDQDRAKAFYTGKLGFELRGDTPYGEGQRWLAVGPAGSETDVILYKPDAEWSHYVATIGKSQALTFEVTDIHHLCQSLKASGVQVVSEPEQLPWGIFATIRDSEGNSLLLVQQ